MEIEALAYQDRPTTADGGFEMVMRIEAALVGKASYDEVRRPSRRPCPECHNRMIEVEMRDFGPRWQCGDCRLTVFMTGGVQPWRGRRPAA